MRSHPGSGRVPRGYDGATRRPGIRPADMAPSGPPEATGRARDEAPFGDGDGDAGRNVKGLPAARRRSPRRVASATWDAGATHLGPRAMRPSTRTATGRRECGWERYSAGRVGRRAASRRPVALAVALATAECVAVDVAGGRQAAEPDDNTLSREARNAPKGGWPVASHGTSALPGQQGRAETQSTGPPAGRSTQRHSPRLPKPRTRADRSRTTPGLFPDAGDACDIDVTASLE